MPITLLLSDHIKQKTVLELGIDVQFQPCGEGCLLNSLPPEGRVVRHGQTEKTMAAILLPQTLLVPLSGAERTEAHVFGRQTNRSNAPERWAKLVNLQHPALMNVRRSCQCLAEVDRVNGVSLLDAGTVPPWQRQISERSSILADSTRIDFSQWSAWMADLSAGLGVLHGKDLSHGDPFPFNVMITPERALWVDFSHLTDDPVQVGNDIWGFVWFTAIYSLGFCQSWSLSLINDLAEVLSAADSRTVANNLALVFSAPRHDLVSELSTPLTIEEIFECFEQKNVLNQSHLMSRAGRQLIAKANSHYYSETYKWMRYGADLSGVLEAERLRHNLVEAELRRLTVPVEELNRLKSERDNALVSEAMHKQALLEQKTSFETQLENLRSQLREVQSENARLKAAYDNAAISEAMHKQALLEQRTSFETQVQYLRDQLREVQNEKAELRTAHDAALASDARYKQAVLEQKAHFETQLASLRSQLQAVLVEKSDLVNAHDVALASATNKTRTLLDQNLRLEAQLHDLQSQWVEYENARKLTRKQYLDLTNQNLGSDLLLTALMSRLELVIRNLNHVQLSRSYQLTRLLRLIKTEIASGSVNRVWALCKRLASTLVGKDALADYLNADFVSKALEQARALESKISQRHAEAVNNSFVSGPELRVGRKVHNQPRPRIAYFTNQLLDWKDHRPRYGGGERYCLTLSRLLRSVGFDVDIYQISPEPFEGEYYGFWVRSLAQGDFYSEYNLDAANRFYEISLQYDHVIYNMPELSAGKMRLDAISICHGIWFDHNNYDLVSYRSPLWFEYLYRAFDNPRQIISVDTNSINVLRSLRPEVTGKMRYIPNFVDDSLFMPPATKRQNAKLRILFPRRSQINRGSRILGQILNRVPHEVEFYWVGEGDAADKQLILDLCKSEPRLHYREENFDQMVNWFQQSDMCVIPTIACEGTSLACVEALACGCATIATNVGGLPDLIQNLTNGLLVDPNPETIAAAINYLIENPNERERLQAAAPLSARAFSLTIWKDEWLTALREMGWKIPADNDAQKPITQLIDADQSQMVAPKVVIVTRNAIHGGVENMIAYESIALHASIIVSGGLNNPNGTCPFPYTYIASYEELLKQLSAFDVVLYHWPFDWAVDAIGDSGLPSIEIVHRTDTSECDKAVPDFILSYSDEVVEYLGQKGVKVHSIPTLVETERFKPDSTRKRSFVGGITSYYHTKGIDLFLRAWAKIKHKYPSMPIRFYGAGDQVEALIELASGLGIHAEFLPAVHKPEDVYGEFRLIVAPSRVEGVPLAPLEALACNIPVIASDIAGHVQINRLAEQRNLQPPLVLFKSEDIDDLARNLDAVLQANSTPDLRTTITSLFSVESHVSALQQFVTKAWQQERRPNTGPKVSLIDEQENTGTPAREAADGFIYIQLVNEGGEELDIEQQSLSAGITATYQRFVAYRYRLPAGTRKVSCAVECGNRNVADIFLQFDWFAEDGRLIASKGSTRRVDQHNRLLYGIQAVPEQAVCAQKVRVVIRPNLEVILPINKIRIRSWA